MVSYRFFTMEQQTKEYDLEIERIIASIKENDYTKVCLQLPDGLKPYADEITDRIMSETDAEVVIWAGSNFGACDLSLDVTRLGVDLLVHFGHGKWVFDETPSLVKQGK